MNVLAGIETYNKVIDILTTREKNELDKNYAAFLKHWLLINDEGYTEIIAAAAVGKETWEATKVMYYENCLTTEHFLHFILHKLDQYKIDNFLDYSNCVDEYKLYSKHFNVILNWYALDDAKLTMAINDYYSNGGDLYAKGDPFGMTNYVSNESTIDHRVRMLLTHIIKNDMIESFMDLKTCIHYNDIFYEATGDFHYSMFDLAVFCESKKILKYLSNIWGYGFSTGILNFLSFKKHDLLEKLLLSFKYHINNNKMCYDNIAYWNEFMKYPIFHYFIFNDLKTINKKTLLNYYITQELKQTEPDYNNIRSAIDNYSLDLLEIKTIKEVNVGHIPKVEEVD
jgi:hypothetical protein